MRQFWQIAAKLFQQACPHNHFRRADSIAAIDTTSFEPFSAMLNPVTAFGRAGARRRQGLLCLKSNGLPICESYVRLFIQDMSRAGECSGNEKIVSRQQQ